MIAFYLVLSLPFVLLIVRRALTKTVVTASCPKPVLLGLSRESWLLLGGLLFLRFGLLLVAPFLSGNGRTPAWASVTFTLGTYLLTVGFIWTERQRLKDFHVDFSSGLILLGQQFYFAIGLASALLFWRRKVTLPRPPSGLWRWMILGPILAICCELLIHLANINPTLAKASNQPAGLGLLLVMVLIQAVNAGVLEEPLFRGFLWCVLRRTGLAAPVVCVTQALLFTVAHVYYLPNEPFLAWFIRLTLPGLLLGLVAWRARSISASIITHGTINATGQLLIFSANTAITVVFLIKVLGWLVCALGLGLLVEYLVRRRQTE